MNELQTIMLTTVQPPMLVETRDGRLMNLVLKAIDTVGKLEDDNNTLRAENKRLNDDLEAIR